MKKITVEEYIKKQQRYVELLIKKAPNVVRVTTPTSTYNTITCTNTLSDEEEKEYFALDRYLNDYYCEFARTVMKKITVEEYVKKHQRYVELLIKKAPDEVITTTTSGKHTTTVMETVTLSDEEEKEYFALSVYLNGYYCEFAHWEDFSDSKFMDVYEHTKAVRNNEPSTFPQDEAKWITRLLARDDAFKRNYAEMFTNW